MCDDNAAERGLLGALALEWARARSHEAKLEAYATADALLFALPDGGAPDLLLLDIDMPGTDGMELAHRLRERGGGAAGAQIVFVTGLAERSLEGYEVDAVSYLLKPVSEGKLFAALDRAWERLGVAEPVLVAQSRGESVRVPLSQICCLEAKGHDTRVSRADGTSIMTSEGIAQVGRELAETSDLFVSVHRSYLVNVSRVRRMTRREAELENGEVVPVARGRADVLNERWMRWVRGQMA